MIERIEAAAGVIQERLVTRAEVAVVLGSGLGGFTDRLTGATSIAYLDVPHWPAAAAVGHAGRLVAGRIGERRVLALSGRTHVYEGYPPDVVTFAIRVVARLGISQLILTNAAGGINPLFSAGTLMVIDDHINLMGQNPLVGSHDPRLGARFPDMSEVYARRLRAIADAAAAARGIPVAHGVYLAVSGPSYETPAEIRAFRTLGADAVGMSTVLEAIVARQCGLEVLGVSCIANAAAGLVPGPLSADDVLATASRAGGTFGDLMEETIARL